MNNRVGRIIRKEEKGTTKKGENKMNNKVGWIGRKIADKEEEDQYKAK